MLASALLSSARRTRTSMRQLSTASPRIFSQFTVFRPEAVLQVATIPPSFKRGAGDSNLLSLVKPGSILLTFAARLPGSTQFDYKGKQMFGLSPVEAANVTLRGMEQTMVLEHVNDMTAKQLEISPGEETLVHPDGTVGGTRFSYRTGPLDESGSPIAEVDMSLTLSHGETFVLTQLMTSAMPSLYGWDRAQQQPPTIV